MEVSTDGKNVDPFKKWVTQQEMDTYIAAIEAARAVNNNPSASSAEVNNALNALAAATRAFNAAKKRAVEVIDLPQPDANNNVSININHNDTDKLIPLTAADNNNNIKVEIPAANQTKVMLQLPTGAGLPKIEAVKGNVSAVIPQGTHVISGDASALELFTAKDVADTAVRDKLSTAIPGDKELDAVNMVIIMGGSSRVEFSNYVTLTFKGMAGKDAAYPKMMCCSLSRNMRATLPGWQRARVNMLLTAETI